jgi:PAS domain S-box-containing protein
MSKESIRQKSILMESEQGLFRAVFDNTYELMVVLSTDGLLLDVNRTALNLIGAKREDIVGKPFIEAPWWQDDAEAREMVTQAVKAGGRGELVRYDSMPTVIGGRLVITNFYLTPVRDMNDNILFLLAEGMDITERVKAERAVREREARYRALVESAPVGICTVTIDGIIESANSSLHKLLGYESEELHGKQVTSILESLYADDKSMKDSLKTGERKIFGVARETTAFHRNGSRVPVELALSLLNLGHMRVFIAIVRDITELRKSKQLQSQLAAIVESSDDSIYGMDLNCVVTSWNPAAEILYGYTSAEVLGKPVLDLTIPPDRAGEIEVFLERMRRGDSIGHFETVRRNKRGKLMDVDLTISPIRNSLGQVVGISTIARDISVRKEAERRISEFYSMVSHELRTPLTSIRASLGLLEGGIAGSIDEEALQLVQIARAESDRLILLINDILDLQKIEAGMLELKYSQVILSELINTVAESLRAMADEYGVKLRASYARDFTFVADQARVIQVIHNLLSNAIKYSAKGSAVKITAEVLPADVLRISVTDRGPGIRADQMHKLFGKFQQLDSSDSRPQGGTGLGLAISKAIVEQHGGKIGVESNVGEGSTFWFEIPMTRRAVVLPAAGTASLSVKAATQSKQAFSPGRSSGPPRVLIVEDDKSTLELLTRQLEWLNMRCVSATDGKTALEILNNSRFDLLILDVGLPDLDGFELVEIIKKRGMVDLPLLVYTSMDLNECDRKRLMLGPSKHIIKSTTSQENIIASVKELLGSLAAEEEVRSER